MRGSAIVQGQLNFLHRQLWVPIMLTMFTKGLFLKIVKIFVVDKWWKSPIVLWNGEKPHQNVSPKNCPREDSLCSPNFEQILCFFVMLNALELKNYTLKFDSHNWEGIFQKSKDGTMFAKRFRVLGKILVSFWDKKVRKRKKRKRKKTSCGKTIGRVVARPLKSGLVKK